MNIIAKTTVDGKILYLKAKPTDNSEMPEPEIGKRYMFCGMITSLVKAFEKTADNLRVETQNSVYLCWIDSLDNAKLFAQSKGLPEPVMLMGDLVYWGCDDRPETYIL